MIGALWSAVGTESVKHHAARLFTGAAVFWLLGAAVVLARRNASVLSDEGLVAGLATAARPLQDLPPVAAGALLVAGLVVVVGSALVAERLTPGVLRMLEGYGRRPAAWRSRRVRRWVAARADAMSTYQTLQARRGSSTPLDADDELALSRAALVLHSIPSSGSLVMPTRLGNVLRAAELRPGQKHGVDAVSSWPRLWLVMPADARTDVGAARGELDAAARAWLWGALLVIWTPWAWWAPLLAVVVAALGYAACVRAAGTYGVLVESAFDVHLPLLYDATRVPRPTTAADERAAGERLALYLHAGSDDPALVFVPASKE